MRNLSSKFESCIDEIESRFLGPYPLDSQVLGSLVSEKPGIYIWFDELNGRKLGYVGQASRLLNRLRQWASELDTAEVYVDYVEKSRLNDTERRWILKAGDLNKK